jgi:hypothetical protein
MADPTILKPWYQKWWGIILIIIFLPFVILYLVWKKTNWNKWVKITITAAFVIIAIISSGAESNQEDKKPLNSVDQNVLDTQKQEEKIDTEGTQPLVKNDGEPSEQINAIQSADDSISKYIGGLAPVDIYLSMEKQGFKTDKKIGGEYGNSWVSTKNVSGIDYKVDTYSSNVNNVESVRATVMIDLNQKEIIAAQQFFIFLSSLPYDSADTQKSAQWVRDNYNNDKASIVIGDAKFTMYAPSAAVRMMDIEKVKN